MNAAARFLNQGALSRHWVVSVLLSRAQFSLLALLISIVLSALSVIYVTNMSRSLNADLQQVLTERDQLHLQWSQLVLEQGTWAAQTRVQQVAEQRLNMVVPDNKSVVVMSVGPEF